MATLDFAVTVRLLDQLTAPLKSVTKATAEANQQFSATKQRLAELNAVQKNLDGYKQLKQQLAGTTQKLTEAQEKAKQLALKFKEAENPSKRLTQQFAKARASVNALQEKQLQQIRTLDQLRGKITGAGTPMRSLLEAERHLRTETAAANSALSNQTSILDQVAARQRKLAESQKALTNARRSLDAGLSRSSNMMISGMGGVYGAKSTFEQTIQPVMGAAIADEASFAGVKKVVDFLNVEEAQQFRQEIQKMSLDMPIAATGLYDIAESGGQLGIAKEKLIGFSKVVAMMSTAFDLLPDQASKAMAPIANKFKLDPSGMEDVGDVINHLSNNTAATASDILEVMNRTSGQGQAFGLDPVQLAALSDSLIALGRSPEVAGTGINALLGRMQTASIQAKPFRKALADIGLSAEELEAKVRKNGQVALLDFLTTLEKLPKERQMNTIGQLFGAEYADDISDLVGNLDEYRKALRLVADESNYAFSIQQEFDSKNATTKANLQKLSNQAEVLKVELGNALLPELNNLLDALKPIIESTTQWARANPETVKTLMMVVSGAAALVAIGGGLTVMLASLIGPFAMLRYVMSVTSIRFGWLLTPLGAVVRAFKLITLVITMAGRALLLSPIGLAITAIAAGAYLIYKNWDKLKAWWNSWTLKDVGYGVGRNLRSGAEIAKSKWQELKNWWDNTTFQQKTVKVASLMNPLQWFWNLAKKVAAWWTGWTPKQVDAKVASGTISVALKLAKRLADFWNNLSLKTLMPKIKMPSMSSNWMTNNKVFDGIRSGLKNFGEGVKAGLSGARASGGPVNAGGIYRVNELGPELLRMRGNTYLMADQNANVIPLRQMVKRTNQHLFGEQGNGQRGQVVDFQQRRQELKTSGVLHIKIDSKEPVRVTRMQSSGMQLNVHTGPIGAVS